MSYYDNRVDDPCVGLCTALACTMLCCAAADAVGNTAGRDRTIGIAMGIIFAIGTIVGIALLATTSSHVWSERGYQVISNARYIPTVVIGGGLFMLLAFSAAASAKN